MGYTCFPNDGIISSIGDLARSTTYNKNIETIIIEMKPIDSLKNIIKNEVYLLPRGWFYLMKHIPYIAYIEIKH
jgi:hypothetical protein